MNLLKMNFSKTSLFLLLIFSFVSIQPKRQSRFKRRLGRVLKGVAFVPKAIIVDIPSSVAGAVDKKANNISTVERGRLYRSAQLSPRRLSKIIRKYGITTVINLRGENPDTKWWQGEREVTRSMGVKLYNIRMSAGNFPPKKEMAKLLYAYDNTKGPILIHCLSGRDRTGEAAALWVLYKMNGSKRKALKQLSFLKYQHVESLYPKKKRLIKKWGGKDWFYNGGYERDILQENVALVVV